MSKKVSANGAKKSKRRLKRSVRKSLAALLMITAIGVAAIPVPENFAEDGLEDGGTPGGGTGSESGGRTDVHTELSYNEDHNNIVNETLNSSDADALDLKRYDDKTTAQIIEDMNDPSKRVYASYTVTEVSGQYDLSWQFIYYTVTLSNQNQRSVVCKYNNEYMADAVELNMSPITQYYTLETSKVIAWYTGGEGGMTGMSWNPHPADTIKYTYDMYEKDLKLNEDDEWFITKYDTTKFNNKLTEFENYRKAKENAENNGESYTEDPPSDYEVMPHEVLYVNEDGIVTQDMLDCYSHFDQNLLSGFTWVQVTDDRLTTPPSTDGNRKTVMVAQHESKAEIAGQCDKNGFMIASGGTAVNICAIGNGAFRDASRVRTLTIPTAIQYIGDEAFQRCTMVTTISLGNVEHLGNRAFDGCSHLESVEFGTGLKVIGAECFKNTSLTTVAMPDTVSIIGMSAFEDCRQLTTLDLSSCNGVNNGCVIKDYAFYNCIALTDIKMTGNIERITSIGKAAFAVASGGNPLDVALPSSISTTAGMGDYMFAGRATLKSVTFPTYYGTGNGSSVTIPDNMFHGCANLEHIEFPVDSNNLYVGGYVNFDSKKLFADVANPEFYVRGPELKNLTDVADPREDTWDAITWVNDYVPYVFKNAQGVDCYEVAIDGYRYQANEKNELTSCVLVSSRTDGNLVIPKTVGKYDIHSIVPGCFGTGPNYSDEAKALRDSIKTITIEDESIYEIGANVFENLPYLTKVSIGNSVTSIGVSAFEGCDKLTEVVFNTPIGGYASFPESNIGVKAFATGSTNLTFNGDIVQGYGPFEWAMNKDNVLNASTGMRVCYKSLAPTLLTVIYDPNTDSRTLIDYPKFDQVDAYLDAIHQAEYTRNGYSSYKDMMAATFYATYQGPEWDDSRRSFREAWEASDGSATENDRVYNSDVFGPWVNQYFIDHYNDGPNANSGMAGTVSEPEPDIVDNVTDTAKGEGMFDWLFEPIVANAANTVSPVAYYTKFPYSAQDNSDNNRGLTSEEADLISAVKNIVVPSGVDSIDVYAYYNGRQIEGFNDNSELINQNRTNARTYLSDTRITGASRDMYLRDNLGDDEIVSGLFSGYYLDSCEEELPNGNDRVERITLTDVTYLPDFAFDSCERLQFVDLGPKCADIGIAPFRGCTSLTTVGGNSYYTEDNGIVYSVKEDGTYKIEECLATRGNKKGEPNISVLTDPNLANVSEINDGAFEDCMDIVSINLEAATGLKVIPERCFKGCEDLNYVYLPDSVNEIKKDAFVFDNPQKSIYVSIPGVEVQIATDSFEPKGPKVTIETYEDTSAYRFAKYYDMTIVVRGNKWPVTFFDIDGTVLGETTVKDGDPIASDQFPEDPDRSSEGLIFKGWKGSMGSEVIDANSRITARATFLAQYDSIEGMVNGKYVVEFYTAFGDKLGNTLYVDPGADIPDEDIPEPRVYEGYRFSQWTPNTFTDIQKATTYIAGYVAIDGSGDGNGGGGSNTNTSGSSTNNGNGNGSSTTTPLGTSTSATSTSSSSTGKYTVTVVGGSGSGTYEVGSTVIISANTPASGKVFSKWTTDSQGVTLASVSMTATTFVMPANNVTVTANYVNGSATNTVSGTVNNGTTTNRPTGTGTGGNTRVDITKPGISNKDLATATVNGSPDNFVVKISETDEATQAVINALTNKYGNMESILYYAMDISLYDSTGTVKITDTTGLSVDITIPIPDALTVFGGNNMAGAVIANSQLEDLSERFTTINGVPCISFTATHFSPYTVYVNTQNLSEGMLDITPKTGDPIHPKWFLSLGLACLSIILFMKKDRKPVKVKAA